MCTPLSPHGPPGFITLGPRPRRMRVPSNAPAIGRAEVDAATAALRSAALTSASHEGGPRVRQFESLSASYTGSRFSVAVNSGTAALQAALLALGVGRGDDVMVPSFTFVATANAVLSVGARPVFVDILDGPCTMDPADLESRMTARTRAVVPVHLYGNVARIGEISAAARRRGAHVVEDAAQALGSTLGGRHAGTFGEIGCYSLYPAKVMTAGGEGGFAVTDRPRLRDRMRMARNHGMPPGRARARGARTLGLNLRMPEAAAAVASAQIARLPRFLGARRRNAERLTRLLSGSNLALPSPRAGEQVNWYLYTVSAGRRRNALSRRLNAAGFGAAAYYPVPVHRMPLYREEPRGRRRRPARPLPATDRAARTVLSLPIHPGVAASDLERMARLTRSVVGPA